VYATDTAAQTRSDQPSPTSLKKLSIDELMSIEVTSVSKTAEPLSEAAAAIYVITHEDVRRSGATTIPELLRLAPNLQVAQVNANSYAITARGFNGTAANKLLVLIDGRSVYTPLFSGVFWDVQAVLPEDIDRIEVISGPGAALWGPNAVNGVINIITRDSRDTPGALMTVAAGDFESSARLRQGGTFGDNGAWRIYGMGLQRDNTGSTTAMPLNDDWYALQGGFRADWSEGKDAMTVQGDFNDARIDRNIPADQQMTGHNLLGRWTRNFGDSSQLQVQTYYDYSKRVTRGGAGDNVSVYDLDVQHGFSLGPSHHIVWGGGYRISRDRFINAPTGARVEPTSRQLTVGNLFVQDTISLRENLELTLGTKFGTNNYTDFAAMPSGRLSWKFSDMHLVWAAISRAVRTPARIDRDIFQNIGPIVAIGGGPDFDDEKLTAYELGYRAQIRPGAALRISTFYNDYDSLRTLELSSSGTVPAALGGRSGFLPIEFKNKMYGYTYGVEIWGDYRLTDWWRLTASYNALREHLRVEQDSLDVGGIQAAGNDPKYQGSLRSSMNLTQSLQLDVSLRKVGSLPNPALPGYTEADARLGWQMSKNLEVAVAGFNLVHKHHREFGTAAEVPRSGIVSARWAF
jgi:iron complex outermembrane recepter protein